MLYQPSELHQFLESLGKSPKKGLSQNFLIDGNILKKIVQAAQVLPGDVVLEIGPGPGALTQALLDAGARVVAVEKDSVFAEALKRLNTPDDRLHVVSDDILLTPIQELLKPYLQPAQKAKVIANLPYHLTSAIVTKLIEMHAVLSLLVLMVQEEVAQRFVALPCTKAYGSLTLFLQYHSHPSYGFSVSNKCFYPPPSVQSAVVLLKLHQPYVVSNSERFFTCTRTAFAHRRKMLRGSLRELYAPEKIMSCLTQIGKDPLARPETLSLPEFIQLFELLEK